MKATFWVIAHLRKKAQHVAILGLGTRNGAEAGKPEKTEVPASQTEHRPPSQTAWDGTLALPLTSSETLFLPHFPCRFHCSWNN